MLPSASAAISQRARTLKVAGEDVIDLGLGEPDFDTPIHIIHAAHAAALAGHTRYPPMTGTTELIAAIQAKFKRDNDLTYSSNQIIVCNGAKQVIFNALMATLEPAQQVLLVAPYFDSYRNIIAVLGGVPVEIPCSADNGFKLTPELLDAAITPATRWILLNSPSNPAGLVYSQAELQAFGEVFRRHPHVLILADEIYEHIVFDGRVAKSFLNTCPDLADRVLTVNGLSKAYAMTGWRVGYGGGPAELISAMAKVQSQVSSGVCSIAQAAAVAALNGPQDHITVFREAFERRRNLVVDRISVLEPLTLYPPGGAFYALIGCQALSGAAAPDGTIIKDDISFSSYLLNEGKVASVPGSTYGVSGFFRISTASSENILANALDRIASCVEKLRVS